MKSYNAKKLITLLFAMLLTSITSSNALVFKISLLTKKLKTGDLHCIWNLYLTHEGAMRNTPEKLKIYTSKKDREDLSCFVKNLNSTTYVEDMGEYSEETNWITSINRVLYKTICKFFSSNKNDLLDNIHQYLKRKYPSCDLVGSQLG